jgi:competence protein ComEA
MSKTYYIFLVLTGFVCLGIGYFLTSYFLCSCEEKKGNFLKDVVGEFSTENSESCDFFVDVSGAVMNPSVVCVHEGAIVNDAVNKAQGFNPSAYAFKYVAQRINLARVLEREEKIYIPFRDDALCQLVEDPQVKYIEKVMGKIEKDEEIIHIEVEKSESKEEGKSSCININTDSKQKIMELKGVGETRAQDIIDQRPFEKIEDIQNVKGIGEKTYESLKEFICI